MAGPVTVCVVVCEENFYKKLKRNKNLPPRGLDSKKLSPISRQKYAEFLSNLKILLTQVSSGNLSEPGRQERAKISAEILRVFRERLGEKEIFNYSIIHISNKTIDKKGLSFCIKTAVGKGIEKLKLNPKNCQVLLDGSLKAPAEFKNQKTIIKGDEKEKIIAWASILAKVSRDALMTRAGKKFPRYGFEIHKGYGTTRHRLAISAHGLSPLHRKTFCTHF